jgi:hypothetical protein
VSDFRELLEKVPNSFDLEIDNKVYTITRDYHLKQLRGNSKIPKDSKMSISKYNIILDKCLTKLISPFAITWISNNSNNIISGTINDNKINIFGAILNSKTHYEKLYPKARNRIHLGTLDFT